MKKLSLILENLFDFLVSILIILFSIFAISLSLLFFYINVKKDDVSERAIRFIEQKFDDKIKITSIDFKVKGLNLFIEIPKIKINCRIFI